MGHYADDNSGCLLNNELLCLAELELNETEQTRQLALVSLRDWLSKQTHIVNCPTDSNFLLRFLRVRKFDVAKAQDVLEKYIAARCAYPQWFSGLDVLDPDVDAIISRGFVFPLPEKDDNGRRVVFSVGKAIIPGETLSSTTMRAMIMTLEALLDDEETQVRGLTYIFDQGTVGFWHLAIWSPGDFQRAFNASEKALPLRHQEVHFLHQHFMIKAGFELFKSFLSVKLKKRLNVHKDVESLAKRIPKRILPREFGGEVPMNIMIDQWKKVLVSKRAKLLALEDIAKIKKS